MLYCLSKLMSLVKEGDMGCASLAAISKHVTDNVIKHGGRLYSNVRFAKYLSIRLTARYSVSVLYSLTACICSIKLTILALSCRLTLLESSLVKSPIA